jgi:hypothetical protein
LTSDGLYNVIRSVFVGLESIGLTVIAVVTDNNAINSKAMSQFATPPELKTQYVHPASPQKPFFFHF